MRGEQRLPKIIWFLWIQGIDLAPEVVRSCLESWRRLNPEWTVRPLDERALPSVLTDDALLRMHAARQHPEAFSDCVRIELLHRYGGVWADATAMCMKPLDDWLPDVISTGFFAFERPAPDRMIASWFLAAERGNYIVERWRRRVIQFWKEPTDRGQEYFWFHRLFADEFRENEHFREIWGHTPKLPANHGGHFAPLDARLTQPATSDQLAMLTTPPAPVFKLSHKLLPDPKPQSFLQAICAHARSTGAQYRPSSPKKILITWYGSFAGHGTIGDLRSLETIVTHLVGRQHEVSHASAHEIDIPGSRRVAWDKADPDSFDGVGFVCGPVLNFHPQTNELFRRFQERRLAGIGVSLLPTSHKHFANPFTDVIAREGGVVDYGDLAILAPIAPTRIDHQGKFVVGIALRGMQGDYGEDTCLWQETEAAATEIAASVLRKREGNVLTIENHLTRSRKTPDEIELQYEACSLIITSRFHGAVTALRYGVPFLALDQIRGGAKVHRLLTNLDWKHVYRVDRLEDVDLRAVAQRLTDKETHADVLRCRQLAVNAAMRTLLQVDRWIASLP